MKKVLCTILRKEFNNETSNTLDSGVCHSLSDHEQF